MVTLTLHACSVLMTLWFHPKPVMLEKIGRRRRLAAIRSTSKFSGGLGNIRQKRKACSDTKNYKLESSGRLFIRWLDLRVRAPETILLGQHSINIRLCLK